MSLNGIPSGRLRGGTSWLHRDSSLSIFGVMCHLEVVGEGRTGKRSDEKEEEPCAQNAGYGCF